MPVAPFVPLIASGIGTAGSLFGQHKAGQQQQAAMAQSAPLMRGAAEQIKLGQPLQAQAASLYQQMLSGNRSVLRSTVQPQRSEITDLYRGAGRQLERSGMGGPQQEVAREELNRDRVGKLADLLPQARLAGLQGAQQFGQQSNSLISTLLGQQNAQGQLALDQRKYGDEQAGILGGNLGKLLTDFYTTYQKSKQKGATA